MAKSATKKTRSVRTSVMLPAECYEQIQSLADANQVSSAWVIRHALLKFLSEQTAQLQLPLRPGER
jgi:predicted transcriptional regulator